MKMHTETAKWNTSDGKQIRVFSGGTDPAPVVYINDFEDTAEKLLESCEERGCPAFHLVSVTGLNWDAEMSPWPEGKLVSPEDNFRGLADTYLKQMETEILPKAEEGLQVQGERILAGYSMEGLFALYAAHKSDKFHLFAAVSASVWYPDFVDYVKKHDFGHDLRGIYLSLGDRESRTKHAYLSQTENNMQELLEEYQSRQIPSVFELNKGNHFRQSIERTAKGIAWTLQVLS